jgi:AcrR family transcriptional regulator
MEKGVQSKNHLIACAAKLFWRNGYYATGLSEILKEADLPKGCFYHYFKSKKDIAVAVIEYYEHKVTEVLKKYAANTQWEEFAERTYHFLTAGTGKDSHNGCPFVVIGMEIAVSEPEIAQVYYASLLKIRDIFGQVLKSSGIPEKDIEEVAEWMLSVYEGQLILFRLHGDTVHLKALKANWIRTFRMLQTQEEGHV